MSNKIERVEGETHPLYKDRVFRIRATEDIGDWVKKGDLGGWVSTLENIEDDGWVYDNAVILSNYARVRDYATMTDTSTLYGHAQLSGNARVRGTVALSGDVTVSGSANLSGNIQANGNINISGSTYVRGGTATGYTLWIEGDVVISDNACITGSGGIVNSKIFGDAHLDLVNTEIDGAEISRPDHLLTVGPVGSESKIAAIYRKENAIAGVVIGCWTGELSDMMDEVKRRRDINWGHGSVAEQKRWMNQYKMLNKMFSGFEKGWGE